MPAGIQNTTPLVPQAVAEAVWEEAGLWLDEELPRAWIAQLASKTDTICENNPRFRRLLLRQGNAGREWLWAFTRHWLAALVWKHRRALHSRLPDSYNIGLPLPPDQFR